MKNKIKQSKQNKVVSLIHGKGLTASWWKERKMDDGEKIRRLFICLNMTIIHFLLPIIWSMFTAILMVTYISYLFGDCSSLLSVILHMFKKKIRWLSFILNVPDIYRRNARRAFVYVSQYQRNILFGKSIARNKESAQSWYLHQKHQKQESDFTQAPL